MRAVAALAFALLVAGCSPLAVTSPVVWGSQVPTPDPSAAADQSVVARGPDSITLSPISPSGASIGVSYGYTMPHCGIHSPIDVDGSYWDAIGISPDSVDFDGRAGLFRLLSNDAADFTETDGRVLNLVRHVGSKEFRLCS